MKKKKSCFKSLRVQKEDQRWELKGGGFKANRKNFLANGSLLKGWGYFRMSEVLSLDMLKQRLGNTLGIWHWLNGLCGLLSL